MMIEELDNKILSVFTKICHKIQSITGKNNYYFAKIIAYLCATCTLIEATNYYYPILIKQTDFIVCLINILITFVLLRDAYICDKLESEKISRVKQYHIFFAKIDHGYIRLFLVLFYLLVGIIEIIEIITFINYNKSDYNIFLEIIYITYPFLFSILVYLLSVDPMPPNAGKIKELVLSFILGKQLALNKNEKKMVNPI